MALCKLHHAAYDAFLLGITPDYVVQVRADVLEEEDGPMLQHGLQGFHGSRIYVPHATESRPDRELLAVQYGRFTAARG
jgi:putative restriction endonuclease